MSEKLRLRRASLGEWGLFVGLPLALAGASAGIVKASIDRIAEIDPTGLPAIGPILLIPLATFVVLFVAGIAAVMKVLCCACAGHGGLPGGKILASALRGTATTLEALTTTLIQADHKLEQVAGNLDFELPAAQFRKRELKEFLPVLPEGLFGIEVTTASVKPFAAAAIGLTTVIDAPIQATTDVAVLLRQAADEVEG